MREENLSSSTLVSSLLRVYISSEVKSCYERCIARCSVRGICHYDFGRRKSGEKDLEQANRLCAGDSLGAIGHG